MHALSRIRSWAPTFKRGFESRQFSVELCVAFGSATFGASLYLLAKLNAKFGYGFGSGIGPSMLPTIDHNLVFVDRFSHRIQGKDYKVGDVVLSEFLVDLSMRTAMCKRVRGVAGDRMAFYPENSETCSIVTVPPGHVWLLGDNCENSLDSRAYGAVPVGMLRGRVFSKMLLEMEGRPHFHFMDYFVDIDTIVGDPGEKVLSRNDSFNLTRLPPGEEEMQLAKLRELCCTPQVPTATPPPQDQGWMQRQGRRPGKGRGRRGYF